MCLPFLEEERDILYHPEEVLNPVYTQLPSGAFFQVK